MIDLDDLERKARAATEGQWFFHDFSALGGDVTVSCDHPASITVAYMGRSLTATLVEQQANAAFIAAANPATILAMIERLRQGQR